MYDEILRELAACTHTALVKAVFTNGKGPVQKALLKPVQIKKMPMWQCETFVDNKAYHQNLAPEDLTAHAGALLDKNQFRQINLILRDRTVSFRLSKKGKLFRSETTTAERPAADLRHNREKQYIFTEGMEIPPLVDLGVFDRDFRVIKSRQDKFKQINRFIEIIAEEFKDCPEKQLTIIDFGCGKSYLTFLVYYYFTFIRGIPVQITGYDLKQDVVADCNKIADKYGYERLQFVVGDISKAQLPEGAVDMILTLHARDTATDYALHFAVKHKIRHIFSVPCCQHELNAQIESDTELLPCC